MVTGLVDTDILIDVLRQHPPAQTWLIQQSSLGVSSIGWIELLQGTSNKLAQKQAIRVLESFERVELETVDFKWTVEALLKFNLRHSLMGLDALIASVSHRLQVPLYTRNLKHFRPILGNLAQSPY
jgi:predicted nucleic acid-binding protein